MWVIFEKSVSKPVIEIKNAFELLKKAQVVKVLAKKIDKPFIQKQDLFNTMVNKFEDKGVSFSQSENAPRQKYRFSDQASLRSH